MMNKIALSFILWVTMVFLLPFSVRAEEETLENLRQEDMLIELERKYPDFFHSLNDVKGISSEHYRDLMNDVRNHWLEFKELEQRNPERALHEITFKRLEINNQILVNKYHRAEEQSTKDEIKNKLRDNLNELFDLKIDKRKMEITHLEKELSKLKSELDNVKNKKKETVEIRLNQLTGGDVFHW